MPSNLKIDAPALLTERERLLLDRMEQLEKRVPELEAKGQLSSFLFSDLSLPSIPIEKCCVNRGAVRTDRENSAAIRKLALRKIGDGLRT